MATTWLTCTRESFYLNIFWSSEKNKYHQYKFKIKDLFTGRNLSGPCTNQSGEEDWVKL